MQQALGMIETRGLVGSIEALDTMVKSANVSFVERKLSGGGLVTVMVEGEVSAVMAAVDAGTAAANALGTVVSTHVIARPGDETSKMWKNGVTPCTSEESTPSASPEEPAADGETH